MAGAEREEKVQEMIDDVGLSNKHDVFSSALSGGTHRPCLICLLPSVCVRVFIFWYCRISIYMGYDVESLCALWRDRSS